MKIDIAVKFQEQICRIASTGLLILVFSSAALAQSKQQAIWTAIKSGGHVVLMRHAEAPGIGDPANFTPGVCATQRNLSVDGRKQAERIGERFRANGIVAASVYSSPWCRCVDTATLLKLGPVAESLMIASTYQNSAPNNPAEDIDAVRNWLATIKSDKAVVVVTHQVNITALTNIFPASGEMIVVRVGDKGEVDVVGSVRTE
jgi:phosphohistidine phosphatase SixA